MNSSAFGVKENEFDLCEIKFLNFNQFKNKVSCEMSPISLMETILSFELNYIFQFALLNAHDVELFGWNFSQ